MKVYHRHQKNHQYNTIDTPIWSSGRITGSHPGGNGKVHFLVSEPQQMHTNEEASNKGFWGHSEELFQHDLLISNVVTYGHPETKYYHTTMGTTPLKC